jgi:metal-responsive CopG/Arc/MetJ family transcriptional regulator
MPGYRYSKRINVTIEPALLTQVDEAAAHYSIARSVIIRLALHDWLGSYSKPKVEPEPEVDYEALAKKYPKVHPGDTELLKFFDDRDNNRL